MYGPDVNNVLANLNPRIKTYSEKTIQLTEVTAN